ncbi:7-carboxy-7-deazaguanine synthase QueE [Celerinatantimonas sp. YJH-8]|uniref:7-carboxy-7-deazaguanine synthase QueE n=1 Tax=Celerinatantimonas sp. YJH-8 TaxID=3228714 RepID=UPI0038C0F59D
MNYRINEVFETIQGEGFYTGTPAIFIRLQGCDVGCPWCDTKHTWEIHLEDERSLMQINQPSQDRNVWAHGDVASLVELVKGYQAKHVVITGGEPCSYDLRPLTTQLHDAGYQCQIETSGTYPISVDSRSWVTVSPKIGMRGKKEVLAQAMTRADEVKHPVGRLADIEALEALLERCPTAAKIALQPISQQPRATQLCIETCIKNNWRLSVQLHKYIGVL